MYGLVYEMGTFYTVNTFPDSVYECDPCDSRLPVHIAVERGMKWSMELILLMNATQQYLKYVDPVTKLPVFALAGMSDDSCDLRTIYHLLRKNPEQIDVLKDGSCRE